MVLLLPSYQKTQNNQYSSQNSIQHPKNIIYSQAIPHENCTSLRKSNTCSKWFTIQGKRLLVGGQT